MQKEKIGAQQIENSYDSKEVGVETSPEQILRTLENNSNTEKESLDEITKRIQNSDSSFKQETTESGILSSLGEKVKKNKLLRAALVGLSLYSANPVFASELEGVLSRSETVESASQSQEKSSDMKQFGNIPESRRKDFEQIFASASEETKRIMLDELENGNGLSDKDILDSNEDIEFLNLQQQIIDLQNSGEMQGKQKITIENASENQIRNWVDYLKNPDEYRKKRVEWDQKNKEGWQNVYPERNPEGHKHANEDYDNIENL